MQYFKKNKIVPLFLVALTGLLFSAINWFLNISSLTSLPKIVGNKETVSAEDALCLYEEENKKLPLFIHCGGFFE
ncbi:MAG: hypothetical protein Q8R36_02890 [bacterium]|nr:hypothetical protein [bacterium]